MSVILPWHYHYEGDDDDGNSIYTQEEMVYLSDSDDELDGSPENPIDLTFDDDDLTDNEGIDSDDEFYLD